MFSKSVAVFLFAAYFATFANAFDGKPVSRISATWQKSSPVGPYLLPITLQDAKYYGWTEIQGAKPSETTIAGMNNPRIVKRDTFKIKYSLGYRNNPRYVLHFNERGEAVGSQVGFPAADVANTGINYANFYGIIPKTLNGVKYYTASFYYAVNVWNKIAVWFEDSGGPIPIPINDAGLKPTKMQKKNCVATIGTHYYNIQSSKSNCAVLFPMIPVLNGAGKFIGVAVQAIGKTSVDPTRTWNEDIGYNGFTAAVSDAPRCMIDAIKKYGLISVHTWLDANSMDINCK